MFIIYDLIFMLFSIIYIPIYLFRGKFHAGFRQRLGILPRDLKLDRPIWVHAVSVGEAVAIKGLVEELRMAYPEKKFVISTVTPTGNKIARGIAHPQDLVVYLPLDLSFIVRSVIRRIKPLFFVIAETEIWPNLISSLYCERIPVITVNGRISDASFKGYLAIRILLKSILNKISLFCVQGNRDKERLLRLGVIPEKVKVTGNMKFDNADNADSRGLSRRPDRIVGGRDPDKNFILDASGHADSADWRSRMGIEPQDKLLVAASTHPGEEGIILAAYQGLLQNFPQLKLLIAPRHPERAKEIERLVTKFGFSPALISRLYQTPNTKHLTPVFILDTIGQLTSIYAVSDIVFVGGSLVKKGGHNILEPIVLGKPVLSGPHMFNFRDIAALFSGKQALITVHNEEELKNRINDLLSDPDIVSGLTQKARELMRENQGATRRNLEYIREVIASGSAL